MGRLKALNEEDSRIAERKIQKMLNQLFLKTEFTEELREVQNKKRYKSVIARVIAVTLLYTIQCINV